MEYLIVAFRSRQETMAFSEAMKGHGVYTEIVNTPKEAGVGCGLSAKISSVHVHLAKRVIRAEALKSFIAVFSVRTYTGGRIVKPVS